MRILGFLVTGLFVLVACQPVEGGYVADPGAQLSAAQTAVSRATGTQQAAAAATYEAYMRQTGAAAAVAQQTAVVETAIAVAATSTHQAIESSLSADATRLHLDRLAREIAREDAAKLAELERIAQAEQLLMQDMARELELRRRQEEIALKRQNIMVYATPLLWLIGIGGAILLVWQFILLKRQENRVIVERVNGHDVPFTVGDNIRVLPGRVVNSTLALPPPSDEPVEEENTRPADWGKLILWSHPVELPLGAILNSPRRQGLILDRNRNPHVLAAGSSGSGKTRGFALPYAMGVWGQNAHVVIVNGKGSDFHALRGLPNVTFFPNWEPVALIEPLAAFLQGIYQEGLRRDEVLRQYNAKSWRELPPSINEAGEVVILIDEFLTLVDAGNIWKLQIRQEQLPPGELRSKTARVDYLVELMWVGLNNVASVSRKHGIHLAVTMTDVNEKRLGMYGMALRRQCFRLAFPMESAAASRAFLDVGRDEGFPRGSVGLPVGQFIAAGSGRFYHGVTFHPSDQDITRFADVKLPGIRPFALPQSIADGAVGNLRVDDTVEGEYRTLTNEGSSDPEDVGIHTEWGFVSPSQVQQIARMTREGRSGRSIEETVFGYAGGGAYHQRKRVCYLLEIGDE